MESKRGNVTTITAIPMPHSERPVAAWEKSMSNRPTHQSYGCVILFFIQIRSKGVRIVVAIAFPCVFGPRRRKVAE